MRIITQWVGLLFVVGCAQAGVTSMRIHFPADNAMGTVHVEATIAAPPAAVWRVFSDVNSWKGLMPLVMDAKFLSDAAAKAIPANAPKDAQLFQKIRSAHPGQSAAPGPTGQATRVAYEAYDLPWPIANEWVVRRYRFDASKAASGNFRATWKKVHDAQGSEPDGYCVLMPSPDNPQQTRLTYHYRVKAKRGLTLALFKIGVKNTIKKMITAIERASAS